MQKLDPFSPRLVAGWFYQATGETLSEGRNVEASRELAAQQKALAAGCVQHTGLNIKGVLVLVRSNKNGTHNQYIISVDSGPLIEAGGHPATLSDNQVQRRLDAVVQKYRQNPKPSCLLDRHDLVVELSWRNSQRFGSDGSPALVNGSASATARVMMDICLRYVSERSKAALRDGRLTLSQSQRFKTVQDLEDSAELETLRGREALRIQEARSKAVKALPDLRSALRTRFRKPEIDTMRIIARRIDPHVLKLMRSLHYFDPLFHAWLTQHLDNSRLERRTTFAHRYPKLLPFAYIYRASAEMLSNAIDSGDEFRGAGGMRRLGRLIAERTGFALSLETVMRVAQMPRLQFPARQSIVLVRSLEYLDRLPASEWPQSAETLSVFSTVMDSLCCHPGLAKAQDRLLKDTRGDWQRFVKEAAAAGAELKTALRSLPAYADKLIEAVVLPRQFAGSGVVPLPDLQSYQTMQSDILSSVPLWEILRLNFALRRPGVLDSLESMAWKLGENDHAYRDRVPQGWLPLIPYFRFVPGSQFDGRPMRGLGLTELTSGRELRDQPILDRSQVSEWENRCLLPATRSVSATYHIFRIEHGSEFSLFMLAATASNKHRYMIEQIGSTSTRVPARHEAAMKAFLSTLLKGRVSEAHPIHDRLAWLERMSGTSFERRIGCDLTRPEIAKSYFAQWQPYVPREPASPPVWLGAFPRRSPSSQGPSVSGRR